MVVEVFNIASVARFHLALQAHQLVDLPAPAQPLAPIREQSVRDQTSTVCAHLRAKSSGCARQIEVNEMQLLTQV